MRGKKQEIVLNYKSFHEAKIGSPSQSETYESENLPYTFTVPDVKHGSTSATGWSSWVSFTMPTVDMVGKQVELRVLFPKVTGIKPTTATVSDYTFNAFATGMIGTHLIQFSGSFCPKTGEVIETDYGAIDVSKFEPIYSNGEFIGFEVAGICLKEIVEISFSVGLDIPRLNNPTCGMAFTFDGDDSILFRIKQ
jgi:hypothetical protein